MAGNQPKNASTFALIPFWVVDALHFKQLEVKDCLSFEKLTQAMSMEDIIDFAAMQCPEFIDLVFHVSSKQLYLYSNLHWEWARNTVVPEAKRVLDNVSQLSWDESRRKQLLQRMFTKEARSEAHKEPFKVMDLSAETVGVILYPGFFTETPTLEQTKTQGKLLEEILKLSYAYSEEHVVHRSELFDCYLHWLDAHTA